MKIYNIRATMVMACAGSFATIAEALVDLPDGKSVYVTAQEYEGIALTVTEHGLYDFMAGNAPEPEEAFLEEYRTWKEAKESGYAVVFDRLRKVMKMLGGC